MKKSSLSRLLDALELAFTGAFAVLAVGAVGAFYLSILALPILLAVWLLLKIVQ